MSTKKRLSPRLERRIKRELRKAPQEEPPRPTPLAVAVHRYVIRSLANAR